MSIILVICSIKQLKVLNWLFQVSREGKKIQKAVKLMIFSCVVHVLIIITVNVLWIITLTMTKINDQSISEGYSWFLVDNIKFY